MKTINDNTHTRRTIAGLAIATLILLASGSRPALAHCDTLNGPVVTDAKTALESGDPTSVLKWVNADAEPEIRAAFDRTLAVRTGGPAARDLADRWFFETLVRVHRAGEGVSFTGLKPAGTGIEPGIEEADHALESGTIDPLVEDLTAAIDASVRERFARVTDAAGRKDASVQAGRAYVEAYVQFIHYIERLHRDATEQAADDHHHTGE